ncbi:hypothetical protein B0H66DRAFT_624901 [Apodospora peruviana]|uniref:Uncharacterized protein n=1 Tax=Apodospora peruviana TaxID=516989 RepID=A0AAE0HZY4_9PEZI|nr:hypothetical protein B0H66DRAFT_624901 [Apodospora peruviana]
MGEEKQSSPEAEASCHMPEDFQQQSRKVNLAVPDLNKTYSAQQIQAYDDLLDMAFKLTNFYTREFTLLGTLSHNYLRLTAQEQEEITPIHTSMKAFSDVCQPPMVQNKADTQQFRMDNFADNKSKVPTEILLNDTPQEILRNIYAGWIEKTVNASVFSLYSDGVYNFFSYVRRAHDTLALIDLVNSSDRTHVCSLLSQQFDDIHTEIVRDINPMMNKHEKHDNIIDIKLITDTKEMVKKAEAYAKAVKNHRLVDAAAMNDDEEEVKERSAKRRKPKADLSKKQEQSIRWRSPQTR